MKLLDPAISRSQERMRRKLLQYSDRIPPLPEIVTRLIEVTDDPTVEPSQIEEVLQFDPVLVGKVISLVNSPLFALNREISTITEAVVLLGFSPLRTMALAYGAGRLMLEDLSCYGYTEKGLWLHSVAVATGSRSLAKSIGFDREASEIMFVAGLLHDIGKLLIAPLLNSRHISISKFPGDVATMEQQASGLDHSEAGALVAAKWSMSETVQEAIKQHHGDQGPADYAQHVAILCLANALAHEEGVGYRAGHSLEAIYRDSHLRTLGLQEETWDKARQEMQVVVHDAIQTMAQFVP